MSLGSALSRAGRALGRGLLRAGARLGRSRTAAFVTSSRAAELNAVHAWIREYLGRPHAELGRKGPVCPFAVPALNDDGLWVVFDDEIDGASAWRLRRGLLRYAEAYAAKARSSPHPDLTALMVVFSRMSRERFARLDEMHSELKTSLMMRDVMVSALHPDSTRPAAWNEQFHVLRAPFPVFVFRTMDVRDIVFVRTNPRAFARYARRFGHLYAEGSVSDEFGYATAFAQAQERFG